MELQTVEVERLFISEEYPEQAAVIQMCFGKFDVRNESGCLENHQRFTDEFFNRCSDNNVDKKHINIYLH